MIKEAIILAGGLGTRLREVIPDLPKCMAPVAGRPFLFYVINYLRSQGIEKFIFSVGYKHETIENYLNEQFSTLDFNCIIEKEPLGTGGAIQLALHKAIEKDVLVVNGDTLFKIDASKLISLHSSKNADCSIALKPMKYFDRYGSVMLNNDHSISGFAEKKFHETGYINGGIYILDKEKFEGETLPEKFSFEKDYLEKFYSKRQLYGLVQDVYFIDIGIPDDYERAQYELAKLPLELTSTDKSWSLFIDRDGVINHEKENDYIRNWNEFRFYKGVKEAMKLFAGKFGKIFLVSNQRGVERGLMSEKDLEEIHINLKQDVGSAGGRIDMIYFCTSIDNKNPNRKPNPGMAFQAKKDFPEIDFSRSIIVGNKPSDMLFGRNAGMHTIYVKTTHPEQEFPHPDIDMVFDSLVDFAKACLPDRQAI